MLTITVKPNQINGRIVAWIDDESDECISLEWFDEGQTIPDDRDGKTSVNLTGRSVLAWLSRKMPGCFADGFRDVTFTYDGRRKLEAH